MNSKCLINAIESRNQTTIQKVLKEGKKKWDPNTDWDEILYYSIKMGEKKLIEKIISLGARDYNMALSSACEIGDFDLVKFFILKGANDWNNALFSSCESGNLELTKYFVSKSKFFFFFFFVFY